MLRSLTTAVTGLQQFQQQMDVIGNNIANVNTNGYKQARSSFADAFSQTLNSSTQVGNGVTTASVSTLFGQGAITNTTSSSDLAISGNGFFVVRNTTDSSQFATRDGSFRKDADGYLVTGSGLRLQGFSDSALGTRGDIKIDATGAPATAAAGAAVKSFSVDAKGQITVSLDDGTNFIRGQVLLQTCQNPQALVKEGNNLYSGLAEAGALAQTEVPGTNGLGSIKGGALELSNVDLSGEFTDLIASQRGFQANSRLITTSDEILQEIINLKR